MADEARSEPAGSARGGVRERRSRRSSDLVGAVGGRLRFQRGCRRSVGAVGARLPLHAGGGSRRCRRARGCRGRNRRQGSLGPVSRPRTVRWGRLGGTDHGRHRAVTRAALKVKGQLDNRRSRAPDRPGIQPRMGDRIELVLQRVPVHRVPVAADVSRVEPSQRRRAATTRRKATVAARSGTPGGSKPTGTPCGSEPMGTPGRSHPTSAPRDALTRGLACERPSPAHPVG